MKSAKIEPPRILTNDLTLCVFNLPWLHTESYSKGYSTKFYNILRYVRRI